MESTYRSVHTLTRGQLTAERQTSTAGRTPNPTSSRPVRTPSQRPVRGASAAQRHPLVIEDPGRWRPGASEAASFWAEALGGPMTFSTEHGDETSVVRMHSGNGPHDEMDRRAIACFDQALADVGIDDDERLRQVLHDYFAWTTKTTMSRYHRSVDDVPDNLDIPHWSWAGLVSAP